MSDCVDRETVLALAKDIVVQTKDGTEYRHRCIDPQEVRELPAVEPERPKGHWEREVDFGNVAHWYCSECHKEGKGTDFCPNCGADMREGDAE